jgi:hypothetical protein
MKKTADTEHGEKITEARLKAIDRRRAQALLDAVANYWREKRFYTTEDGDSVEGILLDNGDCYLCFAFGESFGSLSPGAGRECLHPHSALVISTKRSLSGKGKG